MKRVWIVFFAALMLVSCGSTERQLTKRAFELCAYIPDHELLERSRDYMTEDFYAVLDTMFNLPEHEAMDHEWLYFFVTGNGGTIADYEVTAVEQTDATHALATILVRQKWEDGSFDPENDIEEHRMAMERVNGQWLMADFDDHKADCIRHIAINRKEQALRKAVSDYLIREIGSQYLQGELCAPVLMIVAEEEPDSLHTLVWGDFWVFWYNHSGDSLVMVSGGAHPGRMTVCLQGGRQVVTEFDPVLDGAACTPSAKRIFGTYYDIYQSMSSNEHVREAVRLEQLNDYL